MKVVVLQGGIGREREISLQSGRCVADALQQGGLDIVAADITPDNLAALDQPDVDVFFVALHGEFGEGGNLQQILDDRGLIYTGSGPEASRLAFDKVASKKCFAAAGVAIPATIEIDRKMSRDDIEARLNGLGDRFVVKPIRQGSSVGVYIIDGSCQTAACALRVCDEFGDGMIEPFIAGREITVGVFGRQALPIIEIRSRTGFYDYQAKYIDEQTEYLFDTIADPGLRTRIHRDALACFDALECRDFARVDFILGNDNVPYALEINTIPGFTTHSLLPKAAARVGLSMSQLCVRIVEASFYRKQVQQNVRTVDSDSICF